MSDNEQEAAFQIRARLLDSNELDFQCMLSDFCSYENPAMIWRFDAVNWADVLLTYNHTVGWGTDYKKRRLN